MKSVLNKFKQGNYYILDAYKNNLTKSSLSGITADIYIPWLINAYSIKTILAKPQNNKLDMDSTIHKNHTNDHINESNNRINKIYKNSKFVPKVPKKLHLIWIGPKKPPKSLDKIEASCNQDNIANIIPKPESCNHISFNIYFL